MPDENIPKTSPAVCGAQLIGDYISGLKKEFDNLYREMSALREENTKLRLALLCEVDHAKQVLIVVEPLIKRKDVPLEEIAGAWKNREPE